MIVAKGCKDCAALKNTLRKIASRNDIHIEIEELDFEEDGRAIDLALEYNIDDLPSFVIDGTAFIGPNHDEESIAEAMRKEGE